MSKEITPAASALDSLSRMVDDLERARGDDPLALKGVIQWGWHAVSLLAYLRLQPARQTFDAWIQDYLHEGTLELDIERDARWEERERLSLLELVDLLSEIDLPSLKPEFYQGWQDRTQRCRSLREKVAQVIGKSLSEPEREKLLLLLAVYHRLIRLPAGVAIRVSEVTRAMPALFDLAEMLVDRNSAEVNDLLQIIEKGRRILS